MLTFASAIAFQVLYAIIPLVLFGLGVLGGLGLDEQWTQEWAPTARDAMSPAAFQVVDDTINKVIGGQQTFWILGGAALAIWKSSATMRAVMDIFDRIYESRRERTFAERMRDSLVLGAAVTALLLLAAGCAVLGDEALRAIGIETGAVLWLRWPLALALLFATVTLLVAYAPADHQPRAMGDVRLDRRRHGVGRHVARVRRLSDLARRLRVDLRRARDGRGRADLPVPRLLGRARGRPARRARSRARPQRWLGRYGRGMTSPAAELMQRLGLSDDELCEVLDVDPLAVITGDLDHRPELAILLALTAEAAERVGPRTLQSWLRRKGPNGIPLEHLRSRDFAAFEDDLAVLAERGYVLRSS